MVQRGAAWCSVVQRGRSLVRERAACRLARGRNRRLARGGRVREPSSAVGGATDGERQEGRTLMGGGSLLTGRFLV